MPDPTAPTEPTGSPVVPSALDIQVAQDAAAIDAAPSELQIFIGALENLAAGVIPGLATAGTALEAPSLTPEAAAAAHLLATWLKSLPDAQAAASDPTASAATGIAGAAIAPVIAKLPAILLLCAIGMAGSLMAEDTASRVEAAGSWLIHVQVILSNALPWAICILGALVAVGKVVQPELAKRSPAIGNAIELVDHVADFLYSLLTSKAGKAQDAVADQHTAALTGLLSQLQTAQANPIVNAAIATAVSRLPAASQDAIKSIQGDLPVMLQAIQSNDQKTAADAAPAAKTTT